MFPRVPRSPTNPQIADFLEDGWGPITDKGRIFWETEELGWTPFVPDRAQQQIGNLRAWQELFLLDPGCKGTDAITVHGPDGATLQGPVSGWI